MYYGMNLLVFNIVKIIQNRYICYEAKPCVKTSAPCVMTSASVMQQFFVRCGAAAINNTNTYSTYILPVSKT